MKRALAARGAVALLIAMLALGCSKAFPAAPTGSTSGSTASGTAADLAACVQDINTYRARVGRSVYVQSAALEAFAGLSAQQDAATGTAHSHYMSVNGGGVSASENEYLRQAVGGSVQDAIRSANALFFAEGPSGGHYANLTNPGYTQAGCGIVISNNLITIAEDFR